ncbi:NucA/NucB deoxyribonuclease domain-containing protein [Streptomyces niveiscabiei]|uniref:NucA/NucB deoxyribonuclease domain-containing protein n=1 Tax=Streptomyces niveiscabiei TaxID=164115 RepID=UPI0029BE3118|nr:NucA/NucB deoxyribonuclease domain-containing protein [Streptomyces niveiscabiei]MDX3387568.1 NucA/NucB deoxyribonuclease domain-containing protein [Streptomyces niveiscabiei]
MPLAQKQGGHNLRLKNLLATGVITLGLLSSCLSAAQAADDPTVAEIPTQVVSQATEDTIPLPEDLDESSVELDDLVSSMPDPHEDTPTTLDTPSDGMSQEQSIDSDPTATAGEIQSSCLVQRAIAAAKGSDEPVSCANWSTDIPEADMRKASSAWPTPKWCGESGMNRWLVNRFRACAVFSAKVTIWDPRSGAVVGTLNYLVRAYAYSARDSKNWAYQVELMEVSSTARAKGLTVSGSTTCSGKCRVTKSTFPAQVMSQTKDVVGQSFMEPTIALSPKGQSGWGQATAGWVFTRPDITPTNRITLPTPGVRCDNAFPGMSKPGCVMPYIPELAYARHGEYPELADHIQDAQNSGLPGKHGTKNYLTRVTNKTRMRENRDASCPTSLPRPTGKDCDEYPMASTWQGGKTGKFSRRMIDKDQNRSGGRALANFYLYNRIIEKDRFLVWIK